MTTTDRTAPAVSVRETGRGLAHYRRQALIGMTHIASSYRPWFLTALRDAIGAGIKSGMDFKKQQQVRVQSLAWFQTKEAAELLWAIGLLPEDVEAVLEDPPRLQWVIKHIRGDGRRTGGR
jgi:hypothetical protein